LNQWTCHTSKPFQVLAMLLAQPGEVVTRDELQKHLWPADTFVDDAGAVHHFE